MNKIFIVLILIVVNLNAMLTNTDFINNDIKILKELDLNPSYISDYEFQRYYSKYKKRYKSSYKNKLKKADLFIPTIKKILHDYNIPSAFLYLAMAESNFELKAKSSQKAIGIWQFMPQTAKNYNLKINYYIDERMDIIKSTKAAANYLNRLHKMFDKWYLAALAYNCGEARVIEAITRVTLDKYCLNNKCRNDKTIQSYRQIIKDYQRKKVKFNKLYQVYKKMKKFNYKIDIDSILAIQDNLSRQYLPKESRIYIRKIIALAMMNNSEYLIKDDNEYLLNRGVYTPIVPVKVKGGILLRNIADVVGLSKKELKSLNPHMIQNITPDTNYNYNIYIPYVYLSRFNNNIKNIKPNKFEMHIVKKGDSLSKIARIYGTRYGIIKKFNNLKTNMLSINQSLIIPVDPDTYKKPKHYYVKKGDTLSNIAKQFNVPLKKVMKDNYLKTSMIHIGDKIVINFN